MKSWFKKRLKSKTHIFNTLIGIIGIIEVNFGLLKAQLGDHYGWSFIAVMIIGYILRELTTKPIDQK